MKRLFFALFFLCTSTGWSNVEPWIANVRSKKNVGELINGLSPYLENAQLSQLRRRVAKNNIGLKSSFKYPIKIKESTFQVEGFLLVDQPKKIIFGRKVFLKRQLAQMNSDEIFESIFGNQKKQDEQSARNVASEKKRNRVVRFLVGAYMVFSVIMEQRRKGKNDGLSLCKEGFVQVTKYRWANVGVYQFELSLQEVSNLLGESIQSCNPKVLSKIKKIVSKMSYAEFKNKLRDFSNPGRQEEVTGREETQQ